MYCFLDTFPALLEASCRCAHNIVHHWRLAVLGHHLYVLIHPPDEKPENHPDEVSNATALVRDLGMCTCTSQCHSDSRSL